MAIIFGTLGPDQITPSFISGGVTGMPINYPTADDDTIWGRSGKDYIEGGPGADIFAFFSVNDSPALPLGSPPWSAVYDTISDFNPWEGDRIDLSSIDADVNWWAPGHQPFIESQLSFNPLLGVMTADIYGGNDLQVRVNIVGAAFDEEDGGSFDISFDIFDSIIT
jgi:Ca2+-binding RTX toxin-like protein